MGNLPFNIIGYLKISMMVSVWEKNCFYDWYAETFINGNLIVIIPGFQIIWFFCSSHDG